MMPYNKFKIKGLTEEQVDKSRLKLGPNNLSFKRRNSCLWFGLNL